MPSAKYVQHLEGAAKVCNLCECIASLAGDLEIAPTHLQRKASVECPSDPARKRIVLRQQPYRRHVFSAQHNNALIELIWTILNCENIPHQREASLRTKLSGTIEQRAVHVAISYQLVNSCPHHAQIVISRANHPDLDILDSISSFDLQGIMRHAHKLYEWKKSLQSMAPLI